MHLTANDWTGYSLMELNLNWLKLTEFNLSLLNLSEWTKEEKETDNEKEKFTASGILALQLHAGPPMKVQFKDLEIKKLK